jgi:hypothetical protein
MLPFIHAHEIGNAFKAFTCNAKLRAIADSFLNEESKYEVAKLGEAAVLYLWRLTSRRS